MFSIAVFKFTFWCMLPFFTENTRNHRCRHRRCFVKKSALRNFVKFTGKHLSQSLFFNKVAGLRPATLLKKRLWHSCFHVNFAKFRAPFLSNISGRLPLEAVAQWCSEEWLLWKATVLKNFASFIKKEIQAFSCRFCEIF